MAKKSSAKQHGFWLSFVLILMVIINLLTLALIIGQAKSPQSMNYPYLMAGLFIFTAAKIVSAIGIWFWERWALYVYAGSVIGTIVIGLLLTGTGLFAFNEILPLAILGWLLKDKYDNFK